MLLFCLLISLIPVSVSGNVVLGNAKIYTVKNQEWADAVAFDANGIITAVGSEEQVLSQVNSINVLYIDMQQRMILPGFQDAHLHAVEAGINRDLCYVSPNAGLNRIADILESCPNQGLFADQGWIVGVGIDLALLMERLYNNPSLVYPSTVLDRDYPDTPVLIIDNLGHGAVVNSKAMELVGYLTMQGNPPGGIIERDADTGEPIGIVLENAQQPFRDAAFPPTEANMDLARESLLNAMEVFARNGITSVSDAGGFWRQAQTEAWEQLESEGLLTVRASNALYIYPDMDIDEQIPELIQRFTNDPNKLVRFNQAKVYVDGILGLTTSALYEPYLESLALPPESELGFEYFGDKLTEVTQKLVDAGFQLNFHVTGDRGAGLALDAIEAAQQPGTIAARETMHRLTHLYLVDDKDLPRFADLKVAADFQLSQSSVSASYEQFLENDILGSDRVSRLVPARAVHDAGGFLVLSSDWDADEISPLIKLSTALTSEGRSMPDLDTAIRLMTINPATLLQHAETTGSVEVGKFADFVVLNQDIFTVPPEFIQETEVVATLFQGEAVYDPMDLFAELAEDLPTGPPDTIGMMLSSDTSASAIMKALSIMWLFTSWAVIPTCT